MIDWLNDNSGAVQALSVVVLAVVTAIYAWRTWSISSATTRQAEASKVMAREMEQARFAAAKPIVELRVRRVASDPTPNADSRLRNVGVGPAMNIELEVISGETTRIGVLGAGEETSGYHHIVLETVDGRSMAIVRYEDVFGNPWESQLSVVLADPPRVGQLAVVEGNK